MGFRSFADQQLDPFDVVQSPCRCRRDPRVRHVVGCRLGDGNCHVGGQPLPARDTTCRLEERALLFTPAAAHSVPGGVFPRLQDIPQAMGGALCCVSEVRAYYRLQFGLILLHAFLGTALSALVIGFSLWGVYLFCRSPLSIVTLFHSCIARFFCPSGCI